LETASPGSGWYIGKDLSSTGEDNEDIVRVMLLAPANKLFVAHFDNRVIPQKFMPQVLISEICGLFLR
jgi:hypothetical protein